MVGTHGFLYILWLWTMIIGPSQSHAVSKRTVGMWKPRISSFHDRFYYQVSNRPPSKKVTRLDIYNEPYVLYNYNQSYHALSDKCPHQGASLAKGWVNHRGNIQCPYHAFEFNNQGQFCGIPNPQRRYESSPTRQVYVPPYQTFQFDQDIYLSPARNQSALILPHYPPEHFNDEYVMISDCQTIPTNYRVLTENVLDMLHISYVHSFGNRQFPLPFDVKYTQLSPYAGRSVFRYRPYELTISNQVGKSPVVVVENEFHLPTTTVTRVIAGDVVKTVLTRSTPISENESMFFYSVYRNFWKVDGMPCLNVFGDVLMKLLMRMTLNEDMGILKDVYQDARVGTLATKYDVTILKYREAIDLLPTNKRFESKN